MLHAIKEIFSLIMLMFFALKVNRLEKISAHMCVFVYQYANFCVLVCVPRTLVTGLKAQKWASEP